QGDGVVMFAVPCTIKQRHRPCVDQVAQLLQGAGVRIKFGGVAAAELVPLCRVMAEPAAKSGRGRDFCQPQIRSQSLAPATTRPKAIDTHASALMWLGFVIGATQNAFVHGAPLYSVAGYGLAGFRCVD